MYDIKEEIAKGFALKGKKMWPTYTGRNLDRHKFVTSSEILNCARRIKYEKDWGEAQYVLNKRTDMPFPNWGFAERGNLIEDWIVDMLRLAGHDLVHAGSDQVSFFIGAQSGTPDGMEKFKRGYWVHEFKSIDPRTATRNLPKPAHIAQLQQNMDLVAACKDKPVYGGSLFYIDASNLQRCFQFDVEPDHKYQAELQARAEMIVAADTPADLPNEGMFNGDCDRCGFTAECSRLVAGDFDGLQNAGKGVFK